IWLDYDNDGDKDLYISAYNNGGNRLYQNQGGFSFLDVTATAFGSATNVDAYGSVWADFNKDGWLDLYICLYDVTTTNLLFQSNGDGTFSNVTSGNTANDGDKPSFDAFFTDYNADGWPDLYVVNDKYGYTNGLYRNNGDGSFSDVSAISNANVSIDAMNAGGADYDNDGLLDLYVTNSPEGNVLLKNMGNGSFSDVTVAAGVGFYRIGWAANFFDFDNDMDKDLYVSCLSFGNAANPNALYINQGNGSFTEPLYNTGGLGGIDYGNSYSNAIGDINNDGQLDIAVSQSDPHPFLLWRNDEVNASNWIKVNLLGTTSNADGIGSWIEVWTNGQKQVHYTHCSMGYLGQNSSNYHFGLGSNTTVDSLIIRWPSGIVDRLTNISNLNQVISVVEGEVALPVTLLSFNLLRQNKGVQLAWLTSEETATSHFTVERSADGRNFHSIGQVQAVGNSNTLQNYQFSDPQIPSDLTVYYRLKMIDVDGSYAYSPVRSIYQASTNNKEVFVVTHLPQNPVIEGHIKFNLDAKQIGQVECSLVSRSGQRLKRMTHELELGN
ncbi:MAG: CRTAC1 family protein, partial [Bacteroidota bacterium]